jgi:rod shape-determining protein MreD
MRLFKIGLYILAVIVFQTVVFARLNFLGVMPDLILVSVVAFAVLADRTPSNIFSAVISGLQDIFSTGIYVNTIIKLAINNIINSVKEGYVGDEYSLTISLVALFTPVQLMIEGMIAYCFFGRQFSLFYFIFKMFVGTIYNLMLVPILFPLVKELNRVE